MGKIILLDDLTINKIAAGEVIERPASAVKEVMENSIDAGATQIMVEIRNGGISYIRVTDNGKGIMPDDMEIAFERHATSKLRNADELNEITSMGFRGEALASIAAISKVTLVSKTAENNIGYEVVAEGGKILSKREVGAPNGTSITIENLFYNTPVRYKFLKKDFTESGYIEDVITRIALVHPEIAVKLINTGKTVIQTSGNGDIKPVIYNIYGKEVAENIINIDYTYEDINVKGVIGNPTISRANRVNQLFFVNNRYIKDKTLSSSAEQAFKGLIAPGKHGFLILNLQMDPRQVDVNVHPAKLEVRFQEEGKIFKAVYHAIKDGLLQNGENTEKSEPEKIGLQSSLQREDTTEQELNNLQQANKELNQSNNSYKEPLNYNYRTNLEETKIYKNEKDSSEEEKKNEETFEEVMAKLQKMQTMVNLAKDSEKTENVEEVEKQEEPVTVENAPLIEKKAPVEEISEEHLEENKTNDIEQNNIIEEQKTVPQEELPENLKAQSDQKETTEVSLIGSNQNETSEEDFLAMYEKNFGFAIKPKDENEEKIDAYDEFKPITKIENLSVFENSEQYTYKPVYKFIGITFEDYFIIEMQDSMYIIDQKNAQARIIYEDIKKSYYSNNNKNSQLMLLPDIITLTYKQMGIYKDNREMFEKAGFTIEEFGENTVKVSGVPEIIIELETKDIFLEVLEEINTVARTAKDEIEAKFIECLACKAAQKEKKIDSNEQATKLLDKLLVLEDPFVAPHGKITAIKMTKADIEKKFSRRK